MPDEIDKQTADEVVAGILNPEISTDVKDGITVKGEEAPRRPSINREALAEGERLLAEDASRVSEMQEELASRQFSEVYFSPDASETDRLAAAMALKKVAPGLYQGLIDNLDAEAAEQFLEFYPDEDIETADLPGATLDERVETTALALQQHLAAEKAREDHERLTQERSKTLKEAYAREGITDLDQVIARWEIDGPALEQMGIDMQTAKPNEIKAGLELLAAAEKETARLSKEDAFRSQILGANDVNVSSGFEVLTGNGWVSTQPQADGVKPISSDDFRRRVVARATAKSKPTTVREFREAVASAESANWRDGLTGKDGRPISEDLASGAIERRKKEEAEKRAEMYSALGR